MTLFMVWWVSSSRNSMMVLVSGIVCWREEEAHLPIDFNCRYK